MSGLLDKAEHDFISQVIIDMQNATTAKEIESYANHFVLMMRENAKLKAENELLKQITAEIPLDRLKELKGEKNND